MPDGPYDPDFGPPPPPAFAGAVAVGQRDPAAPAAPEEDPDFGPQLDPDFVGHQNAGVSPQDRAKLLARWEHEINLEDPRLDPATDQVPSASLRSPVTGMWKQEALDRLKWEDLQKEIGFPITRLSHVDAINHAMTQQQAAGDLSQAEAMSGVRVNTDVFRAPDGSLDRSKTLDYYSKIKTGHEDALSGWDAFRANFAGTALQTLTFGAWDPLHGKAFGVETSEMQPDPVTGEWTDQKSPSIGAAGDELLGAYANKHPILSKLEMGAGMLTGMALPGPFMGVLAGSKAALVKGGLSLADAEKVAPIIAMGVASGVTERDVGAGLRGAVFAGVVGKVGATLRTADQGWLATGGVEAVAGVTGSAITQLIADGTFDVNQLKADALVFGVAGMTGKQPLARPRTNASVDAAIAQARIETMARELGITKQEALRRYVEQPVSAAVPEVPAAAGGMATPLEALAAPAPAVTATEAPTAPPTETPVEGAPVSATLPETPFVASTPTLLPAPPASLRKAPPGKSLSEFVRSRRGINADTGGATGEVERLTRLESGTTGLVRRDGGGLDLEAMMQSARESGYDVPEDMRPGDFVDMVEQDVTGRGRSASAQSTDFQSEGDAVLRQQGEEANARLRDAKANGEALPQPVDAEREAIQGEHFDNTSDTSFNPDEFAPTISGTTREGETVQGPVVRETDASYVVKTPDGTKRIPKAEAAVVPPPTELTAPVTPPAPAGEPTTDSIKNRIVERDRRLRGLGPMEQPLRQAWQGVLDEAIDAVVENPNKPYELTAEFAQQPRPLTPLEDAILTIHRVNLRKARKAADAVGLAAADRGDLDAMAEAQTRSSIVSAEYLAADYASKTGGTENARALAFRRVEVAQDYSLVEMETRRQAEQGYEPLTPEQKAETKQLHADLEKALSERDAYHAKIQEIETRLAAPQVPREPPAPRPADYGSKNTLVNIDAYNAAKAALKEKLNRLNLNIPVDILPDLIKIGAFHLEAGARTFAAWSKAVVDDFGEKVTPYLQEAWEKARAEVGKEDLTRVKEGFKKKQDEGGRILEAPRLIQRLAEHFISEGVTDREGLIDKVHDFLAEADPSITRRQTMQAISDYGVFKALNKDPVKARLREVKGEMQELLKLQDMAEGRAPLKTGIERQAPSDAKRELTRRVNEAKRQGGYDVADPETHLKSALAGVKTRLQHQIVDLTRQIKNRVRDLPKRTNVALDAEATALMAQRDSLQKDFDSIFGARGMTDQQRVDAAIKATEKSIAEYERRLEVGDVFPAKSESKTPSNPRLDALRARRDAMRQQVEDIRMAATPHASSYERNLKTMNTRLANRAADLEERVATGNFEPKPKREPTPPNAETIKLQARVDMAEKAWVEALFKDKMEKRTAQQKVMAGVFETTQLAQSFMTGFDVSLLGRQNWWQTVLNPFRTYRQAAGPMVEAMRSKEGEARVTARIQADPNYRLAVQSGVKFTGHGAVTLAHMEELRSSRLAEKVPLLAGSQRAFAMLNASRMDAFNGLIATLPRWFSRKGNVTPNEAKSLAHYVNLTTGIGGSANRAARIEAALTGLRGAFFSPRLVASRFQLLFGTPMWGGTTRTRLLIASEYARFIGGMGLVYGLASAAGASIDWDRRSSDYAKIRLGNTRIDPLGGLQQGLVLASRFQTGEKTDLNGRVSDLTGGGGYKADNFWDVLAKFGRSKLAPIPGAVISARSGTKPTGEPTTWGKEALGLVIPMSVNDTIAAMKEHGIPEGIALGLVSAFGMGVSTFAQKTPGKPHKPPRPPRGQ